MKVISLSALLLWACHAYSQGQMTNHGNLKLHNGAQVTFYGSFANNGTFTDEAQAVAFSGTGTISGSGSTTLKSVTLNSTAALTLSAPLTISQSLSIGMGRVNLNGQTLTIANSSPMALTRGTGYVVSEQVNNTGIIAWQIGSNAANYVFPFGTAAGDAIPFTLQLTSGDIGTVSVSTYTTNSFNEPLPLSPISVAHLNDAEGYDNSANVVKRFWQIEKSGTSGTANITLVATTAEVGGLSDLNAQRWNVSAGAWDAPKAGQANTPNSATVYGVTEFSPWILATSYNGTSLPIELISFDAKLKDGKVRLDWATTMEIDNDYFTVEKSIDGINFTEVVQVDGAGHSTVEHTYHTYDHEPYEGLSYYRLKQTDFDGTYQYSGMQAVTVVSQLVQTVQVFPNPANGDKLWLHLGAAKDEVVTVTISDLLGNTVARYQMPLDAQLELPLEAGIASGTYVVQVSTRNINETLKVMVVR